MSTVRGAQAPPIEARPGDTLTRAWIGLGSNLGRRRATLEAALERLSAFMSERVGDYASGRDFPG